MLIMAFLASWANLCEAVLAQSLTLLYRHTRADNTILCTSESPALYYLVHGGKRKSNHWLFKQDGCAVALKAFVRQNHTSVGDVYRRHAFYLLLVWDKLFQCLQSYLIFYSQCYLSYVDRSTLYIYTNGREDSEQTSQDSD